MSSGRGISWNNGGGGGGVQIPLGCRKMVESLKEIVNCPEPEIYAMLQDCDMDPNDAVHRLISQDPFHEVKSKRDKKKENKDTTVSRSRGVSNASHRGGKSNTDHYVGRGSSTKFSSSEPAPMDGKPAYKKENGANPYRSSSLSAFGVAWSNMNQRPPTHAESYTTDNKIPTINAVDVISSASQPSSQYQPAWLAVPGQVSMADIVKMGKPHDSTSSTANPSQYSATPHHLQGPPSTASPPDFHTSESHDYKNSERKTENGVTSAQQVSSDDEWPMIEHQPAASVPSVLEPLPDCELHPDVDRINQHSQFQVDEVLAADDGAIENLRANHVEPASVSSRKTLEDNAGGESLYDHNTYTNLRQSHCLERREVYIGLLHDIPIAVENVGVSVASVTTNLQQVSIHEEQGAPRQEDGPAVVIPNHLQVQIANCSHLSFGSFGSGISAAFSETFASRPLETNLDEIPVDADASSVGHLDIRNSEYYGDESLRSAADGTLGHRPGTNAGSYDSPSASQPEVFKQENHEVARGNQSAYHSSTVGYTFKNIQELTNAFNQSELCPQMPNLAPFTSVMEYTNSLPTPSSAANVQPVRESDLPYSHYPMTQSMPAKYGNTVSSIGSSTISMPEALRTRVFSSNQSIPQTLSGTNASTGPPLPQHLSMHPYSQHPLGPYANMIGYPFLPQSYTYMPSAFQQTLAGNGTYHQSLAAAVLPQYKNSVSLGSLSQSAAVASGYDAFVNSNTVPGNFPMNTPTAPAGTTIGYEDVMNSLYQDSNHLTSLQQNENSAMWLHGPSSRTMSPVPTNATYYGFEGQSQRTGGYQQGQQPSHNYGALGYPNFYRSQNGISVEHQQNSRDGSLSGSQSQPKQSQQIWQNNY